MTNSSRRPLLPWRAKAIIALIIFVVLQIIVVRFAVADRVPPTVTTKDATIQYGETFELSPFVRVNDDRSEATITGLYVDPNAWVTVSDDLKTMTFQKAGTYTINVFAEDESGNTTIGELKVTMEPPVRETPDPSQIEGGTVQPDVTPFPIPDRTVIPGNGLDASQGSFVVGEQVTAGLYKLIGTSEKHGRVDYGSIRVVSHMMEGIDVDIAILDALILNGDFYGSKWVYLSEGMEFELDPGTVMVAEDDVPETLYSQVFLDGMYCAGVDIEPGKYLIQARQSSEQDAGHWYTSELLDFVYYTYLQDMKIGSISYADETDEGDEVWVYRGQFLRIESCIATKIS